MSQPLEALAQGNRIRLAGAAFKRKVDAMGHPDGLFYLAAELRANEIPVAIGAIPIDRYLRSAHRIGQGGVCRVLRRAGIQRWHTRVRDLTERERHAIARVLEDR